MTKQVEVTQVTHYPHCNSFEDGVKKDAYHIYYDLLSERGEYEYTGGQMFMALDPLELFTRAMNYLQKIHPVEPNSVIWETTAWGK